MAVDLRRGSPTFGRWVGTGCRTENHRQLWIPPGFAHGFYVLSEQRRPACTSAPTHYVRRARARAALGRPRRSASRGRCVGGAADALAQGRRRPRLRRRAGLPVSRRRRGGRADHRRRAGSSAGSCRPRRRRVGESIACGSAELDVTRPGAVADVLAAGAAGRGDQRRRLHRGGCGRSRSAERARGGQLPRARATWPRPPSEVGARLIHVSTDFVFDGAQGRPYRPGRPAAPARACTGGPSSRASAR